MQMMDGKWIDQAKHSYEYNKAHEHTVRILYTRPQAREGHQAIESALTRLQKRYAELEAKCQAREWVGLTDKEADKIYKHGTTFGEMFRMVEAKLREKNNG